MGDFIPETDLDQLSVQYKYKRRPYAFDELGHEG